jgi:hypothetical protein
MWSDWHDAAELQPPLSQPHASAAAVEHNSSTPNHTPIDTQRTEQLLWLAQREVQMLKDGNFEHEDEIAQAKKTVVALAWCSFLDGVRC